MKPFLGESGSDSLRELRHEFRAMGERLDVLVDTSAEYFDEIPTSVLNNASEIYQALAEIEQTLRAHEEAPL